MAKRKSRFISEAAQQALVRFGPELSGLRELQRQAEKNFSTGVQTARVSGAAIGAAIDEAAPQVARIYDRAGLDQARVAHTLVGQDLAGLGGVANSIKAGASLEAGAMAGRLGEARANALTELQTRGVQAREGEGFAVKKARDEFVEAIGQVLRRKQDVRREKGAFTSATAGDLREASRDRALRLHIEQLGNDQSEENSWRSAGYTGDPAKGGKPIPGGPADMNDPRDKPKGRRGATGEKLATGEQHEKRSSYIAELRTEVSEAVEDLKASGFKGDKKALRRAVARELQTERPSRTTWVKKDKGGKILETRDAQPGDREMRAGDWQRVDDPGSKARPADVWMTAALDSTLDGHLAPKTQERLQGRYSVRDLGFGEGGDYGLTAGEYRRKNRGSYRGPGKSVRGRGPQGLPG